MIDVRLLRNTPDAVRVAMERRAKPDLLDQVDHAVRLDTRLRDIVVERDEVRRQVNDISKQVGSLRKAGDTAGAE
ncbi:MAG: serine--tRNA ligase, partial [Ilumatobacteraceae bacterium]|nr:serine--tRNA ligase [Ilumatobacteraceae bacterium]